MAKWSRAMLESLLAERGWGTSRVRGALGVYRRFIAWCAAVGYACGDFVGEFKPPRARPLEVRSQVKLPQLRVEERCEDHEGVDLDAPRP